MLLVYHGSNSRFQKLRISEKLCHRVSTRDNEGLGIYFSTDRRVAASYGKYVYTLAINENYFLDFRKRQTCTKYINELVRFLHAKTGVNALQFCNVSIIAEYVYCGGVAVCGIGKELMMNLASADNFYTTLSQSKVEKVHKCLMNYDKRHLYAYMFNYHIPNIGVIKNVSEDVVKIINVEASC